jgi:hypothetical protein
MAEATVHFPRGFLWGAATAAHQVEGNNTNNNWHAWEQQEGRIIHGDKSGLACDWWGGRWKEDLDRAAETGQNAHRFSIEWSRIQPAPDRWDEEALERYRLMLRGMLERGLMPMVTLHHFSNPLWLEAGRRIDTRKTALAQVRGSTGDVTYWGRQRTQRLCIRRLWRTFRKSISMRVAVMANLRADMRGLRPSRSSPGAGGLVHELSFHLSGQQFTARQVGGGIPGEGVQRHVSPCGNGWEITPDL